MYLAQFNVAHAIDDLDSETLKEFVDSLDYVNGIAETSPGFIARNLEPVTDITGFDLLDDKRTIYTLTLWQDIASLKNFLFNSPHLSFYKQKKRWFMPTNEANYVLWWRQDKNLPTLEEAVVKLMELREQGSNDDVFTLR
ncbi:DUF3291 domain-containing protein [Thalassotalea aquiviva]|uniref:DUF3291 domain-containing protein n=1 Tax=Thalassotalea aquiviva TaxID=3242415 RepID=UPI00352A14B5